TKAVDHALGFANPLTGPLDPVLKTLGVNSTAVTSGCSKGAGCTSSNRLPSRLQNGLDIQLPAGLGEINIAGAQSITANVVNQRGASGQMGVLSTSNSQIANLDILKLGSGKGWAHIDAISLLPKAFGNGVKSEAIAEAKSSATGGDVGGLLGMHISNADL